MESRQKDVQGLSVMGGKGRGQEEENVVVGLAYRAGAGLMTVICTMARRLSVAAAAQALALEKYLILLF